MLKVTSYLWGLSILLTNQLPALPHLATCFPQKEVPSPPGTSLSLCPAGLDVLCELTAYTPLRESCFLHLLVYQGSSTECAHNENIMCLGLCVLGEGKGLPFWEQLNSGT